MNNLTRDDVKSFKNASVRTLLARSGTCYVSGNDEEVVVCLNHLSKRLELEESYSKALKYAVADAHLSATISDYSSSALSLSSIANLLNAQSDGDSSYIFPAYYTSVMSLEHLLGLHYLSYDDEVPPIVSEDTLERFLLLKKICLDNISQNVDYSFSIHALLANFTLTDTTVCIRHILHNFKKSLSYFDAIIKAMKRTTNLLEANGILLNNAVTYSKLLIMRYKDSSGFLQSIKSISSKLLTHDMRLTYHLARCNYMCMHYTSQIFWKGFWQVEIHLPEPGKKIPLSALLLKLSSSNVTISKDSIAKKIPTVFSHLMTDLRVSNCCHVVLDNTLSELAELMEHYPLLTYFLVPFMKNRLSSLDRTLLETIQKALNSMTHCYDYLTSNVIMIDKATTYSDTIELIKKVSANNVVGLSIMPGLMVYSTTGPGTVVLLYNFLRSINLLKESFQYSIKYEAPASTRQVGELISYAQSVNKLLSTAIDGTLLDKTLFFFSHFLLTDYCNTAQDNPFESEHSDLSIALFETVVLAGQYIFVVIQELECSSVMELLKNIYEDVLFISNNLNEDLLLSLAISVHKAFLAIILNILNNSILYSGWNNIVTIITATYEILCDILSYKKPITIYTRFLRTVLHGFYSSLDILAIMSDKKSYCRKELLDLLQILYDNASILCLDIRFEQLLPKEERSQSHEMSSSQLAILLTNLAEEYNLSCTLFRTKRLFSYSQNFDLDSWMVKNKVVKEPRHNKVRAQFLEKNPHIQSNIQKLDTNSAYGAATAIFKNNECVYTQEENVCNMLRKSSVSSSEEDITTATPVNDTDTQDILKAEPAIKASTTASHSINLFAPSSEEQKMQTLLMGVYSKYGLKPRDLVMMSVSPDERVLSLEEAHLAKHMSRDDIFMCACYIVKQLLNAEDIAMQCAHSGSVGCLKEIVHISLNDVCIAQTDINDFLKFLTARGTRLILRLSNSFASQVVFLAIAGACTDSYLSKRGSLAEESIVSLQKSSLPFSALFRFISGMGRLCNQSTIILTNCVDVPTDTPIFSDEVSPEQESSVISFLDLTGTNLLVQSFQLAIAKITIQDLFLNAATFSSDFFVALLASSIHVKALHMRRISLEALKIASRVTYEDIPGLEMVEVSCIDKDRSSPYYKILKTLKNFGIEVRIADD